MQSNEISDKRLAEMIAEQNRWLAVSELTPQEQFFFDNAGFSYDPKTQTELEGHIETAKHLAAAETWAVQNGYSFSIKHDDDADESFMDDESEEYRREWSGKAWYCQMLDPDDKVVQSLSSCYGNADYKRVVRAELALEEMPSDVMAEAS